MLQGEVLLLKEENRRPPPALVLAFDCQDLLKPDNGEPPF
jgi:hypothetical protein